MKAFVALAWAQQGSHDMTIVLFKNVPGGGRLAEDCAFPSPHRAGESCILLLVCSWSQLGQVLGGVSHELSSQGTEDFASCFQHFQQMMQAEQLQLPAAAFTACKVELRACDISILTSSSTILPLR